MTTILVTMPVATYRRMMTPALEAELEALGHIVHCFNAHELSEEEYAARWQEADAALTGWSVRPPTPAMLDCAPRLKIICHTAGTVRMFPRYALEKGIVITSARAAIARTVAEHCLLSVLTLLRRSLYDLDSSPSRKAFLLKQGLRAGPSGATRAGRHAGSGLHGRAATLHRLRALRRAFLHGEGPRPYTQTLYGKTVGLIGYGSIAAIFRKLIEPFGCRVLVYDPFLSEEEATQSAVEPTDLHTLLRSAQIVSLHAPDIPSTQGMIGAKELAMMADGAIFLNTARGRLVDTDALTAQLRTGRLFAAIDVTDPEPLPRSHPLRNLPNVLFTPHVAGPTDDELSTMTRMALTDLSRHLQGAAPIYSISLAGYDLMSY